MKLENTSIDTVIVDDESLARTRIRNLIAEHQSFNLVGEAENGTDALFLIKKTKPDLIFLDISLPGIDGFNILEQAKSDHNPIIIVVSGSEEHAIKAFDYYAFDYLLKPYRDARFFKALDNVIHHFKMYQNKTAEDTAGQEQINETTAAKNDFIPIKNAGKIQFIATEQIEYIEASGYYIEINTKDKKHLLRQSMSRILNKLDPSRFIRIHRSIIINLHFMQEITRSSNKDYLVRMKNGKLFKVSKSYKKQLFAKLNL